MKKLFYLVLMLGLGLTVAACGDKTTTTTTTTTAPTTQGTTSKPTAQQQTTSDDKNAPMIILKNDAVEVMRGEQEFDAYKNLDDAFDDKDASVSKDSVQIDMGGYEGIDTPEGVYTVTYTVSDKAGNTTTLKTIVTVVEVEPSVIFTTPDGQEYSWPMNYNPIINAQYTQGYGLDQWAYDLTKVTVLSKDYFEYVEEAVYERISASWSTIMITDANFEVVYVRDGNTSEFYYEEGFVVSAVGTNWCTGTATGVNNAYCDVTEGRQMANITGEGAHDYAKVPEGGYIFVFINNGANIGYDCPRGFGQRIMDVDASTGGVGQTLKLVGAGKEFSASNAPAYVKTDKKAVDAYYGDQIDLLEGISYVSYNNATLDVTYEVYPIVSGLADFENKLDTLDTTAPAAGADGKVPATSYLVKYSVTENGRTDFLTRVYTLKDNDSVVQSTQERLTIGSLTTLVYYNTPGALQQTDSGLGMVVANNDRPHLFDVTTLKNELAAAKEAGTASLKYQYGAYFLLDGNLNVIQFVFAIGTDQVVTKDAEGNWTSVALGTGSVHNLLNDFAGENPIVDLNKAAFVLFTQNTAANNATVRQFGVNLWNSAGAFKDDTSTPDVVEGTFDQQEFLNTNAAVITQEGLNSAGRVLETKTYTVNATFAGPDGTVYASSYDHDWYWQGGAADKSGNTNLRFSGEMLHVISQEFSAKLEGYYSYIPWASMVILDKDLKVVGVRAFYEAVENGAIVKVLIYVHYDAEGNLVVTPADQDGNWNPYNNFDAASKIAEYIPEGGYAFPLITGASITNPLLLGILGDINNPTINDYQFVRVYQLVIA